MVTIAEPPPRPTLVVPAATTWEAFPALWPELSGEVWGCLRAAGVVRGAPNVMLYLDDVPHVEVGVLCDRPVAVSGRVVASSLPGGRVATTTHRGPYAGLAAAHAAVLAWCDAHGEQTTRVRYEVYGPHGDDPAGPSVEIAWLLA